MLYGVDISQFQGIVDFDTLKNNKDFVVIRSNFGSPDSATVPNIDEQFERNKSEARRTGMLRTFYHYAYPEYNSPQSEADYLATLFSDIQEGESIWLDWEEKYNGDHVQWVLQFLQELENKLHVKAVPYMNLNEATSHDWSPVINAGYAIALAAWDGTTNDIYPSVQWPFLAWKQYADNGSVAGINGNVDLDVFYGDAEAYKKYGYQTPHPTPTPTPQPTPTPTPDPLQAQLDASEAKVTDLIEELSTVNNKLQVAEKQITDLQAQNDPLTKELAFMQDSLNGKNEIINNDIAQIAQYQKQIENDKQILFESSHQLINVKNLLALAQSEQKTFRYFFSLLASKIFRRNVKA